MICYLTDFRSDFILKNPISMVVTLNKSILKLLYIDVQHTGYKVLREALVVFLH